MNRKRVPPSMIAGSVILIFFALIAWIFYEVSVKQRKINVPHIDDID